MNPRSASSSRLPSTPIRAIDEVDQVEHADVRSYKGNLVQRPAARQAVRQPARSTPAPRSPVSTRSWRAAATPRAMPGSPMPAAIERATPELEAIVRAWCDARGRNPRRRRLTRPMEQPTARLELDAIRHAPKVLLHDHLDGGLRPQTVIELAREIGYRELPTTDPDELRAGSPRAPTASRSSSTSRASATRWRSCRPATRSSGSAPSASRTSPRTASSTPRCAWRPSS